MNPEQEADVAVPRGWNLPGREMDWGAVTGPGAMRAHPAPACARARPMPTGVCRRHPRPEQPPCPAPSSTTARAALGGHREDLRVLKES